MLTPASAAARQTPAPDVVNVPLRHSIVLDIPRNIERVAISDPEIAEAVVVSAREIVIHARALGTTTLIVWDVGGGRRSYRVGVTPDVETLTRLLAVMFPDDTIHVRAVDGAVALTGRIGDARRHQRVLDAAAATGATVLDGLLVAPPRQILLEVRIAEVSRSAIEELSTSLLAATPYPLHWRGEGVAEVETLSDGLIRLLLLDASGTRLAAFIRALRTSGSFRALAEPNLIAVEGAEASFLAGGEFPFPIAQRGADAGVVTIEWREFGVRLVFVPTITEAGGIRLRVAPEVSSLDFSTGLIVQGFAVPSLLMRRAETEVELASGQTFAIAGLMDHSTVESVTRLPLLGSLPVIGALFRSRLQRQNDTELLVLVTPRFVTASDVPPPLPVPPPR